MSLRALRSVVVEAFNKFCYWYFFCSQYNFNFKTSSNKLCVVFANVQIFWAFFFCTHISRSSVKVLPVTRCNPQQYSHSTISTAHVVHRVLSAFLCPPLADLRGKTFMATKRGLRRKMCMRKVAYATYDIAKAALRTVRRLHVNDERQIPYHCRWCGRWHNGHAPGHVRQAILNRQARW